MVQTESTETPSAHFRQHRLAVIILSVTIGLFLFTACQPALLSPPRQATQEALSASELTVATSTPIRVPLESSGNALPPTPVSANDVSLNPSVTVWVNETSPAHQAVLEEMRVDLDRNFGLYLEFILVDPARLPDLVNTAALSGTLPDLILHPVEYSVGWADQGILSPELAEESLAALQPQTFESAALELVRTQQSGQIAAIPSDNWSQVLIYRQDWFDSLGLAPPITFQNIISGAQVIYRSGTLGAQTGISTTLISGLVIPTESDLVSTHQVFEQLALANGCQLIDQKGELQILDPTCLDTLDFYRTLINRFSPSDVQTDISAINAYLAGRTGMILSSPNALVQIAGGDPEFVPSCPECRADPNFLANNTAVAVAIQGRSDTARSVGYRHLTYLGITAVADPALAQQFSSYWFDEGYLKWLSVESARKAPLRHGTPDQPDQFLTDWQELPADNRGLTLRDLYGQMLLETLLSSSRESADTVTDARWGFATGHGALITDIHESFLFSIILQEMLSGYFNSTQAVVETYGRLVELIPNYRFEVDPTQPSSPPENESESDDA